MTLKDFSYNIGALEKKSLTLYSLQKDLITSWLTPDRSGGLVMITDVT